MSPHAPARYTFRAAPAIERPIVSDVKRAIDGGDAKQLRDLLRADPTLANALVRWGRDGCIETHPLHYVSDAVFEGTLDRVKAIFLVDVLIGAGADVNFHTPGEREAPLVGAASLGAEEVALRLIDAGAAVDARGLFDETPLHWAAHMGMDRLVARLIAVGAAVDAQDRKYGSTPLGWALHGWTDAPAGERPGHHAEVVGRLVAAGAAVRPEWLASAEVQARPEVLAALQGG